MSKVLDFAIERHRGQEYAGRPFIEHPIAVVQVLMRYGITEQAILDAALLHDILEDTDATRLELVQQFGEDVATLVWRVTDEPGVNRKIRKALTYPKIAADDRAIIVKLADRIANCIQGGSEGRGGKQQMYQAEHPAFLDALPMQPTSIWYGMYRAMLHELAMMFALTTEADKETMR